MSSHFQTNPATTTPVNAPPAINFEAFFSDADSTSDGADDDIDLSADQSFLVFGLGGQRFALSVRTVREILDPCTIVPLPNVPDIVKGLIDLRGEAVAVVDVSANLGVTPQEIGTQRIIVFDAAEASDRPIGVLADQVFHVAEILPVAMERPPNLDGADPMRILHGIARLDGQMTLVLDQARLLLAHQVDLSCLGDV